MLRYMALQRLEIRHQIKKAKIFTRRNKLQFQLGSMTTGTDITKAKLATLSIYLESMEVRTSILLGITDKEV